MGPMPTLGLKLPLRICVLENAACVEDAGGRRTGFVYWDEGRPGGGDSAFTRAEAIEQVRIIASAWAGALVHSGTLDTGPAPEPGAAAAEPSPEG
ncbi:hypothetical protein PQI07_32420 [Methylobacterium sp. 092160098-2]|uniref:hypothetical protein n=1 Tax=Methylobacterium TaxID=407 RepID=UPI00185AB931|nr:MULTISPECIES: hypothetical protein [Methylobacterium]MDE4915288.1 hypothetical protein [Methylobacterium sp. 092160098-2]MDH3031202.1 hypothetical protein [Methylobacterium fujisawaense]